MYLGIDLGTSGVKVLIIDESQNIVASSHAPLEVTRPHTGWSEQAPQDWIDATRSALLQLKTHNNNEIAAVRGIGLSGQMHGATLLDANHKVLRPCILWNDTRSHAQAANLDADPDFRELSGNIVFPGFTAPKLLWVKENEPEVFARVSHILLPKDYLRFWLSGELVSEPSDASGTSWLDVGKRQWSSQLIEKSGIHPDWLPRLVESNGVSGVLRSELAQEFGLSPNVVIAGGAGDNAASAIGMGTIDAGSGFLSLGTSGVLFAANDQYLPNPQSAVHAFCHALPKKWHQMGVILSATDALNWFVKITDVDAATLVGELGEELRLPSDITFLPYLSGERTPHNDANIRGSFVGLDHGNGRTDLTQSIIEGVGFGFHDSLIALQNAGTQLERVTAVGGGSKSVYWLKTIATILNLPIDVPADGDFGSGFGAARLGLMAAENIAPESVCIKPEISRVIGPESNLVRAFEDAYQQYANLYPALRDLNR